MANKRVVLEEGHDTLTAHFYSPLPIATIVLATVLLELNGCHPFFDLFFRAVAGPRFVGGGVVVYEHFDAAALAA